MLFLGVLFLAAVATADVDWSTVRHRDIVLPNIPFMKSLIPEGGRIVGGEEAVPNSLPYQAALLITAAGGTFFCGGSLISQRFVMTAAHCIEGATVVEVRLGAHFVQQNEPTQVRVFSSRVIIHPAWNPATLVNDIGLIELPAPVALSAHIQPVTLPRYSDVGTSFAGSEGRLSGWGLDRDGATAISQMLRQVFVNVITNLACNISFLGIIQPTHVCSSGAGGRGACSGDSGGPYVVGFTQIGAISFGLGLGCEIGWPSAHTRISSFLDWIAANSDANIAP